MTTALIAITAFIWSLRFSTEKKNYFYPEVSTKLLICFSHFHFRNFDVLAQFRSFAIVSCHLSLCPLTHSLCVQIIGIHFVYTDDIDTSAGHCQIVYTFGTQKCFSFLTSPFGHSELKTFETFEIIAGIWKKNLLGFASLMKMAKLNGLISDDMSIIVNNGKKDLLKREKSREEKGNWGNKWEFLFSGLSYAVGLGNVWRLVQTLYQLDIHCILYAVFYTKF